MDDAARNMAECWRDLSGDATGMVWMLIDGTPSDLRSVTGDLEMQEDPDGDSISEMYLPDPSAPANWGVWASAAKHMAGTLPMWLAEQWDGRLPWRLLGWLCRMHEAMKDPWGPLPPSVQAWWAEQQEAGTDAE